MRAHRPAVAGAGGTVDSRPVAGRSRVRAAAGLPRLHCPSRGAAGMSDALPSKVQRARLQPMLRHPYPAAALGRLPVVNADELGWCETMATDGYTIYFNSSFCEGLSEDALVGVFAHEVLHCILGHIDRRGSRHRVLWNVAIDHATNLLLKQFN